MGLRPRGFTLVELLVAIVLIGVMCGMAMIAMGNADRGEQQQLEAERLAKLLELAEQEAMVRAESIGLELASDDYRFLFIEQGEWRPAAGDAVFRPRQLPAGMAIALKLDGKTLFLSRQFGGKTHPEPQIVLAADGGLESEFQIGIAMHNSVGEYRVSNNTDTGFAVSQAAIEP